MRERYQCAQPQRRRRRRQYCTFSTGEVDLSADPIAAPLVGAACKTGMLNRPKTKAISVAISVLFISLFPSLKVTQFRI